MLERIGTQDPIWQNPPYLAEETLFLLMHKLCKVEEGLFLTDRRHILLAQTSPDMPAWVWTAPDASEEALAALREACRDYDISKVTARPETVPVVFDGFDVTKRLLGQSCPVLRMPEGVEGMCSHPNAGDEMQIATMLAGFEERATGVLHDAERFMQTAEKICTSEDFAVWRDTGGNIVAMAMITLRTPRHACISRVYTMPDARCRGFAGAVVGTLCQRIMEEGRIPALYTDGDYPNSNRAYAKIGFCPDGELHTATRR